MKSWPTDYRWLTDTGALERLVNPTDALVVWDVEFIPQAEIPSFVPLDDKVVDITPFARSANGDYWAYISSELPSSKVVRCYRDSYYGDRVADNLAELIFMQTVLMAGIEITGQDAAWTMADVVGNVRNVRRSFAQLLTKEMSRYLESIEQSPGTLAESRTLIEESVATEIVTEIVPAYSLGDEFEWRE